MKQKLEALTSANAACADLLAQRNNVEGKRNTYQAEAQALHGKLILAEKEYQECEGRCLRGLATDTQVSEAKALANGLREKMGEAERLYDLAKEECSKVNFELADAEGYARAKLSEYCKAVEAGMIQDIGRDAKLRAKLMEGFAANRLNGTLDSGNWAVYLTEIFPEPGEEEIAGASSALKAKHHLP